MPPLKRMSLITPALLGAAMPSEWVWDGMHGELGKWGLSSSGSQLSSFSLLMRCRVIFLPAISSLLLAAWAGSAAALLAHSRPQLSHMWDQCTPVALALPEHAMLVVLPGRQAVELTGPRVHWSCLQGQHQCWLGCV